RQPQKLREVAPRSEVVRRPVDRELLPPRGLLAGIRVLRDVVRVVDLHGVLPPSIAARSGSSPANAPPAGASGKAAPTSSAAAEPRRTMRCTFVVISCIPKRNAWIGCELGRSRLISSRVP